MITTLVLGAAAVLFIAHKKRKSRNLVIEKADSKIRSPHPHEKYIHELLNSKVLPFQSPINPSPLPPATVVSTIADLESSIKHLASARRIAIDLEHHDQHTYYGKTCLIQMSDGEVDYIIDVLALGFEACRVLSEILSNDKIVKVLHGGNGDVIWLHRDLHIHLINIFDTEKACQVIKSDGKSLAFLLETYCQVTKDHAMQLMDWRERPLTQRMIKYAQTDVHYLLHIADCLGQELCAQGMATEAIQRSLLLCYSVFTPSLSKAAASASAVSIFMSRIPFLKKEIGEDARDEETRNDCFKLASRVYALCSWRDASARVIDEGVSCVLPDAALFDLAWCADDVTETTLREVVARYPPSCHIFPAYILENRVAVLDALGESREWHHPEITLMLEKWKSISRSGTLTAKNRSRESLAARFTIKKEQAYENCRMLSFEGHLLCYTDRKRLEWYVRKNLAKVVSAEPFTVQLLFQHNMRDQSASVDTFYSAARNNHCVGCGKTSQFLKYRILPSCYRRALPVSLKSHRSHDVVLICLMCHETAQQTSERLKGAIAKELGIPLFQPIPKLTDSVGDLHAHNVRRSAIALDSASSIMPVSRKQELEGHIAAYLGIDLKPSGLSEFEKVEGLLAGLSRKSRKKLINTWVQNKSRTVPSHLLVEIDSNDGSQYSLNQNELRGSAGHYWHGAQVVQKLLGEQGIDGLLQLQARFRQAFVESVKPKHLPSGWSIEHVAVRSFGEHSIFQE